jgi:hypothetical protein
MATDLYFDLTAALRLAERALAAPDHNPSFTEHAENRACTGALEWVADWGTYLMSGGRPGLRADPHDPDSRHVVVYAEGWDEHSDRSALAATDVGGDDFVEHLHLTEAVTADGQTLIDLMRARAARGHTWLVLTVADNEMSLHVCGHGPANR